MNHLYNAYEVFLPMDEKLSVSVARLEMIKRENRAFRDKDISAFATTAKIKRDAVKAAIIAISKDEAERVKDNHWNIPWYRPMKRYWAGVSDYAKRWRGIRDIHDKRIRTGRHMLALDEDYRMDGKLFPDMPGFHKEVQELEQVIKLLKKLKANMGNKCAQDVVQLSDEENKVIFG